MEWADLGSVERPDLRNEDLDSVVSMNVLEHLPDDEAVVRKFWNVLRPGGRLMLLVAAHARLFGAIDDAVGHHRRYDLPTLAHLLRRNGFELDHIAISTRQEFWAGS